MTMVSGTTRLAIVGLAASAALAAAPRVSAAPAAGAATSSGARYYLSLGDSLAQGYQPIGGPWSPLGFPGYNQGYADQLLKLVRDRHEHLRLVKLGCGGETTTTMIVGSPWCGSGFAAGSQLAEAEVFLQAHRGEVAFVTLDIGGNDISPGGDGMAAIHANLPTILAHLREAAGPGVPIVGMNYYHPFFPDVWFGTHDAAALRARSTRSPQSTTSSPACTRRPIFRSPTWRAHLRRVTSATPTLTACPTTWKRCALGRGGAHPHHTVPTSIPTTPATA
jgi:lysophospholipase L1-like esterase